MRDLLTILLLFVLADVKFLSAQEDFNFELDYSRFFYDSTNVYVEFYYSFNQKDLKLLEDNGEFRVQALLHLSLFDSTKNEYFIDKSYKVQNIVKDTSKASMQTDIMGAFGLVIPEGKYEMTVIGKDMNNTDQKKEIHEVMNVEPFPSNSIIVSDVQLASRIIYDGANPNSIFYKNSLEVFPNPSMVYYYSSPVLFYYAELYNLLSTADSNELILQKVLYDSEGIIVYKKSKNFTPNKNSIVDFGLVNLSKYPTNTYSFVLSLIDTVNQIYSNSYKKFYFYNPGVESTIYAQSTGGGMLESEFAVFSIEECDYMYEVVKFIASSQEKEQYEKLDSLATKRNFLFDFWNRRDPDASTIRNEFKEEYMQRAKYVDKTYGNRYRKGYKSDRGRIFLLFGEPDQIDRFPSEPYLKPYEVWSYNSIESGVQFVFGDLTGFSSYELIHSNKRGELRDDNWMRRIQTQ